MTRGELLAICRGLRSIAADSEAAIKRQRDRLLEHVSMYRNGPST